MCGVDALDGYSYLIWPDIQDILNGDTSALNKTVCVKYCPGNVGLISGE